MGFWLQFLHNSNLKVDQWKVWLIHLTPSNGQITSQQIYGKVN
jgi:hypothetical protein